jgi:photosynthetic reaction center cytochrome c subunit
MARALNNDYLNPLNSVLPSERLGKAMRDAPKVTCSTCHNGVSKPLFGVSMARNFPELTGLPSGEARQGADAVDPASSDVFEIPPWQR